MDSIEVGRILKENRITNYKIFENSNRGGYNLCYMDREGKGVGVHIDDISHLKKYLQSLITTNQ